MESSAIELMLDFALDAYDREENEQPITCVLQCLADLSNKLFDVQLNCKEESVRLWARSIDTRDFDERLAQRTDRLVQLLGLDDGVDEVAVQPLGMMRLRVVEFFASRFRCTNAVRKQNCPFPSPCKIVYLICVYSTFTLAICLYGLRPWIHFSPLSSAHRSRLEKWLCMKFLANFSTCSSQRNTTAFFMLSLQEL